MESPADDLSAGWMHAAIPMASKTALKSAQRASLNGHVPLSTAVPQQFLAARIAQSPA